MNPRWKVRGLPAIRCLLPLVLIVTNGPGGTALARPPERGGGPPAPPSPVARAQQCYGQGDLGCVLQALESTEVAPAEAAERWRLLALAAARLDRHDVARKAFAAWIALADSHRLDRATTPPAIWQDYQAALLDKYAGELDLTPHVEHTPVLPAPAATVADLPRFGPPPRSGRDGATDFSFAIHGNAALHPARAAAPSFPAGGMAVDVHLAPRWRAGVQAEALQFTAAAQGLDAEQAFLVFAAQARAGYQVQQRGPHGLDVVLGVGGAAIGDAAVAIGSVGLRYAFAPPGQTFGGFAALSGLAISDTPGILPLGTLSVGLTLRPVATRGPAGRAAGGGS